MNESIRLLEAEIQADLHAIEEAYRHLEKVSPRYAEPETGLVVGYYLHLIYSLFENLFTRIAAAFENRIANQAHWHTELLRRMTLDVKETRPPVIGQETFACLDELRRFRHLFRNAYLLHFDADRLALVLQSARKLKRLYPADLKAFLHFLDSLAQQGPDEAA